MSHFSVLVIGENVEEQLAAYHEFECTGRDDQYVQDIDVTDKYRTEWETDTVTRYRDPDGNLHDPYEERFYRDPTLEEERKHGLGRHGFVGTGGNSELSWTSKDWGDGRGYRAKVHFVPEGWQEVEAKRKEVFTFLELLTDYHSMKTLRAGQEPGEEHQYGYVQLNAAGEVEKVIDRTNPEARWDWWVIGGRWTGFFKLKPGAKGRTGRPGVMTEPAPAGYADQALKGDVDLEQMRTDAEVKARALWKRTREITGGQTWESWDDMKLRFKTGEDADGDPIVDIKMVREEYGAQPAIILLREHDKKHGTHNYSFGLDDDLALEEAIYVERERNAAVCTFAYVKDGQWHERAKMGMFASTSGGVSAVQWHSHFNQMLDALPDDVLLSAIDCHI